MDFWQTMPIGMLLRSNWTATCIAEHEGPLALSSYMEAKDLDFPLPVPLDTFIDYGLWVAGQVSPDADHRRVSNIRKGPGGFVLTLGDESQLRASRVVVAAGISEFTHRPEFTEGLPPELVSHTADHHDLSRFAGQRVLVVGGGQSALESAALLSESGADVTIAVRADQLTWLHGGKYHRMLGRFSKVVYAPTDVGPMGISRVVAVPGLFTRLPRAVQDPMAHRSIRPAGAAWLKPRIADLPIHLGTTVRSIQARGAGAHVALDGAPDLDVDHVLCGTGYRVDVGRYSFLDPTLTRAVRTVRGYPVLKPGMESSVPGLHFMGAPGAYSFGPIMRFVAGGWYGATTLTAQVTRRRTSAFPRPSPVQDAA